MRHYDIYLLEDDVAREYRVKEQLLFRLFCEAVKETDPDRSRILQKQIAYITHPIPAEHIGRILRQNPRVQKRGDELFIQHRDDGFVRLRLGHDRIIMYASGNKGAETFVFETLRRIHPHFLAVDYQDLRSAWLRPFRKLLLYDDLA